MSDKVEASLQARQAAILEESEFSEDDAPWTVHGVAIGPEDVTKGKNGRKVWSAATLQKAAETLEGKPLVRDHINSVIGNIGEVVNSKYKEGVGVLFEAEIDHAGLAEKIERGRLDVSARIKHLPTEELEKDEEHNAHRVEGPAAFANLAVVNNGAAPSNEVNLGGAAALSHDELQDELTDEEVDESDEASASSANGEDGSPDEADGSASNEGNESSQPEESANNESDGSSDESDNSNIDDPVSARNVGIASLSYYKNDYAIMEYTELAEDKVPEGVDASSPVLVDEAELSALQEKANRADEDFDDLKESISELSEIRERKEDLEEEVEELREKAEAVEDVKEMHAEELAEAAGDIVETDDFMHLELSELRERTEDLELDEDEVEEEELEENDPDPQSEDVENEELEENEGTEYDEEEVAELEDKLEWYEQRGWDNQVEELEAELEEIKGE